jgi:hypothetical protein
MRIVKMIREAATLRSLLSGRMVARGLLSRVVAAVVNVIVDEP